MPEAKTLTKQEMLERYRFLRRVGYWIVWFVSWSAWLGHLGRNGFHRCGFRATFMEKELWGFDRGVRKGMLDNGVPVRDIEWVVEEGSK